MAVICAAARKFCDSAITRCDCSEVFQSTEGVFNGIVIFVQTIEAIRDVLPQNWYITRRLYKPSLLSLRQILVSSHLMTDKKLVALSWVWSHCATGQERSYRTNTTRSVWGDVISDIFRVNVELEYPDWLTVQRESTICLGT